MSASEERFVVHKRAIRNTNEENGLSDHIAKNERHHVDWSEASIITSENRRHHRCKTYLAALYIKYSHRSSEMDMCMNLAEQG